MQESSKYSQTQHEKLILEILRELQETSYLTGISTLSSSLRQALEELPRQTFIDTSSQNRAYENKSLPIGYGQTISQPFIVVLMTELLEVKKTDIILEIGTGSGWQAAILSKLCHYLTTIEIIPELSENAKHHLKSLNCKNVNVRTGSGWEGWSAGGPYDKIIVTAAAENLPLNLLTQLKFGGKMVIPLGKQTESQILTLIIKDYAGNISKIPLLPVLFVPFVDADGKIK